MTLESDLPLRAAEYARVAHASIGHVRKYTGLPYFVHVDSVAQICAAHMCSHDVVAAAYLHDILEDVAPKNTDYGPDAIRRHFGEYILQLVRECTDISRPQDGNRAARKAIDREHFARACADAQDIKLADLIDNTTDICAHDKDFARVYLPEMVLLLPRLKRARASLREHAQDVLSVALFDFGEWDQ